MSRVLPSQIVQFIDKSFPRAKMAQDTSQRFAIQPVYIGFLRGLSDLFEKVDDFLLPQGDEYSLLIGAVSAIRAQLELWTRSDPRDAHDLDDLAGSRENPVIVMRRILERCSDSAVSPSISGLEFISDPAYRDHLRQELASIEELFEARQWKATMVLAGSLMEALLCDQIMGNTTPAIDAAVKALVSRKDVRSGLGSNPLNWHLPEYLKVAEELRLIGAKTKEQALLSADFRNLVHPGKALRDQVSCDRAATYTVLAGLEHVIKDLS